MYFGFSWGRLQGLGDIESDVGYGDVTAACKCFVHEVVTGDKNSKIGIKALTLKG